MGNFKRDNQRATIMYPAVCSKCRKNCEVPFQPNGSKPIFCNTCFGKNEREHPNQSARRNDDRPYSSDKRTFSAVCDKCGQDCEVPFRPTGEKPVFCKSCFSKDSYIGKYPGTATTDDQLKAVKVQLEDIQAKLDQLIQAVIPVKPKKVITKSKKV